MRELKGNLSFKLALIFMIILFTYFLGIILSSEVNAKQSDVECLTEAVYCYYGKS